MTKRVSSGRSSLIGNARPIGNPVGFPTIAGFAGFPLTSVSCGRTGSFTPLKTRNESLPGVRNPCGALQLSNRSNPSGASYLRGLLTTTTYYQESQQETHFLRDTPCRKRCAETDARTYSRGDLIAAAAKQGFGRSIRPEPGVYQPTALGIWMSYYTRKSYGIW
ncbi:hypothetical protein An07g00690 [Aspergillus niger]|uniref:Uncharacterized protein n=2 Tax=Aspergillus niger TaxID=5061 RepID=A2QM38_ASPNC|nr:hypothetical protein An07g00690 [Aspergillus niger]CAK39292.1 hypothetical protein An07g00690 [Aspergillus niger]